jgi:hypothetical protein
MLVGSLQRKGLLMDVSKTTPKAMGALEAILNSKRRMKPLSGAEVCRGRAKACRDQAASIADADMIRGLLALAPKWDQLALEMEREGVSAADLPKSV